MRALGLAVALLTTGLLLSGCGLFRSAPEQAAVPAQSAVEEGEKGSIRLSLIDRSTLRPAPAELKWRVRSHPSHRLGEQVVYDGNSAAPHLQLASGWYLVDVQHDRGVTTHVFEIYPSIHQDMHLVRMAM